MLGTSNNLVFPRLRFVADSHIVRKGERRQAVEIFKLDWQQFDERLRAKHDKWLTDHHGGEGTPFMSGLPSLYDGLVYEYRFALSPYYFDEIRRCACQAAYEWTTQRRFDTVIRDLCLKPAIAYVMVAFELLADCIYDPDTKNFSRKPDRYFAANMMTHKFWCHQTGRGVVETHAGIPELRRRLERHFQRKNTELAEPLDAFLVALDAHREAYTIAYREAHVSESADVQ